MKTFYDVLKISENASIDEINLSYNQLKEKYKEALKDPFNSSKAEEALKRLDVAYKVLGTEETKKAYDRDLANMRANELMSNLQKNTNSYNDELKVQEEIKRKEEQEKAEKEALEQKKREEQLEKEKLQFVQNEIEKQIQEQQKQLKIERERKKKADEARAQEYRSYLRQMGVNVKEPLTVKRFFKILGATVIVLLVVFLIFQIPAVKNAIENNEALKMVLEMFS